MAKKSLLTLSSTFFLQLALGVFFLVLGISNLMRHDSSLDELRRAFGRNDALYIIMAVIEIVMGAVLVLGLFVSGSAELAKILSIALFIFWAVYMFVAFLLQNFLEPSFLAWFYGLSWHFIILISLWIVGRKYM
jgi:uncharacterized membrane protein YphA (DoxX/SURF4 family)